MYAFPPEGLRGPQCLPVRGSGTDPEEMSGLQWEEEQLARVRANPSPAPPPAEDLRGDVLSVEEEGIIARRISAQRSS